MESLYSLFRELGNSLNLGETFGVLDQQLRALIPCGAMALHLVAGEGMRLACGRGPGWQALTSGELASIPSQVAATNAPAFNTHFAGTDWSGVAVSVPLQVGADLIAVLTLCRAVDDHFSDHDLAVLRELAPKLAAACANAVAFEKAICLARMDPSTGELSSRAVIEHLDREIARLRRIRGTLAVVEFTIRGPEVMGLISQYDFARQAFDRVERELPKCCREYDFMARCGERFVLVLPQCGRAGMDALEERVKLVVGEIGLNIGLPLTIRLGAAFCPEDGMDAKGLLAAAEQRLVAGLDGLPDLTPKDVPQALMK
jgi:GGDEF domain-containing protein